MPSQTIPKYRVEAFNELKASNALKADGKSEYKLKSGRLSPYFFNMGDLNTGKSTAFLGRTYANALHEALGDNFDLIYGIPEKGVSLAPATAVEYYNLFGIDKAWFFTRKFNKKHGEGTNVATPVVGRQPKDGDRVVLLDDVLTTGKAKYEAIEELKTLVKGIQIVGLVIMIDRQEVAVTGMNAVEEFHQKTGIPVFSVMKATDVYSLSSTSDEPEAGKKMGLFLTAYGTKEASNYVGKYVPDFSTIQKNGIIPACDLDSLASFEELVKQTAPIEGISGYKLGFELGLRFGLPKVVEIVRKYTDKEIIYDHQKAATDIPDTGKAFAKLVKGAGINTVILFPQSGPETERAWIYRAYEQGLGVIVGGIMTHPAYIQSEGGFILDQAALDIYRIAASAGVNRFVVPGTKPDIVSRVKSILEGEGVTDQIFYAPGLVTQGGSIETINSVLGNNWHAIIGRAIVNAEGGAYYEAANKQVRELLRQSPGGGTNSGMASVVA